MCRSVNEVENLRISELTGTYIHVHTSPKCHGEGNSNNTLKTTLFAIKRILVVR